jgi:hypothetical protein
MQGTSESMAVNFGQRTFAYTPPAGFKSLNTKNLNEQSPFANGPDLVWIKRRNGSSQHTISDTVRNSNRELFSSSTAAEQSGTGQFLQEFNSNGFTLGGSQSGTGDANITGGTYVGWNWNAGSRSVGNQDGTINSTVRANPAAGFSIVSYTGTGANGTVGHGLGVAPSMILVKRRDTTNDWAVQHISVPATQVMTFNTTAVATTASTFQNSNPTLSTFSIAGISSATNASGGTYVAYCWSEIEGYSRFGRYTGNGSTDGPFVYTGFSPKYIMWKRTDATGDWIVQDTSRAVANPRDATLYPHLSAVEAVGGGYPIDILSNGFKLRNSASFANANGGSYIYAAFAEMPSRYALAK